MKGKSAKSYGSSVRNVDKYASKEVEKIKPRECDELLFGVSNDGQGAGTLISFSNTF